MNPMRLRVLLSILILLLSGLAAAKEPLVFTDPGQEARYQQLTLELRCLV